MGISRNGPEFTTFVVPQEWLCVAHSGRGKHLVSPFPAGNPLACNGNILTRIDSRNSKLSMGHDQATQKGLAAHRLSITGLIGQRFDSDDGVKAAVLNPFYHRLISFFADGIHDLPKQ
ncbi:hypothetical protein TNCV_4102351 [Trichonephila clavipes]|nr:hypothetical protein TNCV_4102351 [Trichonephila clavipes]